MKLADEIQLCCLFVQLELEHEFFVSQAISCSYLFDEIGCQTINSLCRAGENRPINRAD